LYNLIEDPAEAKNLQAEKESIVEQYRQELAEIVTNGRSTPGAPQANDGPETWPQLDWMQK
jgi:hypothetical protein